MSFQKLQQLRPNSGISVLCWLTKPFGEELVFFLLFLFFNICPVFYYYVNLHCITYGLYVFGAMCCLSYAASLGVVIIKHFNRKVGKGLKLLALAYSFISYIVEFSCYLTTKAFFSNDFTAIIFGTNAGEAAEFFATYVDKRFLFFLLFSVVMTVLLVALGRMASKRPIARLVCLAFIGGCFLASIHKATCWMDTRILSLLTFRLPERSPDLKPYYTAPKLISTAKRHPKNVVMIIGESFAKSHSSLYGYEKPTNPRLCSLHDSSRLYVFSQVISPELQTIKAFKRFMSTWQPSEEAENEWFKGTTINEVVERCGYSTYWISNQSKIGFWDNIVGKYADLCAYSRFVGNKFAGLNRATFDEEVLPLLRSVQQKEARQAERNFYFVHLMGSHPAFEQRYPANRNHFKSSDYQKYPIHQREKRASYDNSILYNDSVVNEIIKCFAESEAVIVYFSDHGLDVYQSANDFCAHGNAQSPKSKAAAEAIPFMVYASPQYSLRFPATIAKLKIATNRPFTTDHLIYTVMDLVGVKFAANNNVQCYSLLR